MNYKVHFRGSLLVAMVRRSLGLIVVVACLFGVVSLAATTTVMGVGGPAETNHSPAAGSAGDGGTLPADRDGEGPESRQTTGEESHGLLPRWEEAYEGNCVDCHAPGQSQSKPIHPTMVDDAAVTESWFHDDGQQTGPDRSMKNEQPSWVTVKGKQLDCSDCHGVTDMGSFGSGKANRTANPHAVHQAYTNTHSCSRCHGDRASAATHGVVSPMEMTGFRDGDLLASEAEARYRGPDLGAGVGWTKYGEADSALSVPRSCGDCHGKLHGARMGFAFDETTRAGPLSDSESNTGLAYRSVSLDCEACHPSDVHAVHTDARIMDNVTVTELRSGDRPATPGAETCLECHGSGIVEQNGPHWKKETARMLGLMGPKDSAPNSTIAGMPGGDCGFCHR